MNARPLLASLLALFFALTLSGCGPQCAVLKDDHEAFARKFQGGADSTRAPHLSIAMPRAALTEAIDAAAARIPRTPVDLPGLGDVGRYVPNRLEFTPRALQLSVDKADAARLRLDFDVNYDGRALFGLDLTAKAPITVNTSRGTLRFSIRGDLFESVTPRLDEGAARKLADALWGQLPSVARAVVQRGLVDRLAREGIEYLTSRGYVLLRERVLKRIGEIASFEIGMPAVPIEALTLTSVGSGANGVFRLDVRTSLPVENGLGESSLSALAAAAAKSPKDALRVQIAAETVTALANWAMGRGKLPSRYDDTGKPSREGGVQVGAAWGGSDARPLKVHLWSLGTPQMCVYGRAAGVPTVEYDAAKGKLAVGIKDSSVEEFKGPALLRAVAFLPSVTQNMFDFSKTIAMKTQLGIGSKTFRVNLQRAAFDGRTFTVDLSTSTAPKSGT